jgi:hypothetical protein
MVQTGRLGHEHEAEAAGRLAHFKLRMIST